MTHTIIYDTMCLGDAMKKILFLFICLLFITGCDIKVYDYKVEDWKMEVTESSVKRHINLYIEENPNTEKTIFEIACEIVGVDYNKYK